VDLAEDLRISGRLRNALVADLVIADVDADHWLTVNLRDPRDLTHHLGRQLGLETYSAGGIHETLMVVLPELDRLLQVWPLRPDVKWCRQLAHDATKNIPSLDLYATFLAGPPSWRRERLQDCSVGKLHIHLQSKLEACLGSELNRMLTDWVKWDVRNLADRRRKALDEAKAAREAALAEERRASRERTPRADRPRPGSYFQPPGRS
jgi:hypothetical protein